LIDTSNGSEYPLHDTVSVLGRARDCSVRIKHPALSRYHAMIRRAGDAWTLSDMKSLNGVFLNGRRIRAARLRHNDDVMIGEHRLVFRLVGLPDERVVTRSLESTLATKPADEVGEKEEIATEITRFTS